MFKKEALSVILNNLRIPTDNIERRDLNLELIELARQFNSVISAINKVDDSDLRDEGSSILREAFVIVAQIKKSGNEKYPYKGELKYSSQKWRTAMSNHLIDIALLNI